MTTVRHISGDQNEIELTDGKKYVAAESDGSCKGCSFKHSGPCSLVPCGPVDYGGLTTRHDGGHVIFKEKENEDHEG